MSIALPEKFVETMRQALGEEADSLFAALDTEPVVSIRLNPYKPAELFDGEAIGWSPNGRYLASRPQFTLDAPMHGGAYYVQEASSQFVGYLLKDEEVTNGRVLDMCAAPGSKTCHIGELLKNKGKIIAVDLYEHRLDLLEKAINRLGLRNVELKAHDSTKLHETYKEKSFDKILLDAPCSGLGVIRRKMDIKFNVSPESIDELVALQKELIEEAYVLLKDKGILVYSTCTINKKENEKQIVNFINKHKDMKVIEERTILPFEKDSDGFYYCKMIKEG